MKDKNMRCAACYSVSKIEYADDQERHDYMAKEILRKDLSNLIQKDKTKRFERDHHIEFRLELYVATPEEFWEIVEQRALEIASRMGNLRG